MQEENTPKRADRANLAIIISVLAIICSGASAAYTFSRRGYTSNPISFSTDGGNNSAQFVEGSISDVANRVAPAVVSITTETRTQSWYGQSSSKAAGTGFIISRDGYVLTNKHVVDGANTISVVLDNGTTYDDIDLIGTDPLNDVAVLKIKNANELPTVVLGDSKTVTVGQQVIAIGNALGQYQNSVTEGIISGLNRSLIASSGSGFDSSYETLTDMLQTDASINQGNSGGPLVNAAGEVVGINTAVSASGNSLGFAIPISSVKGIVKTVLSTGKFSRAFLGVYYTALTADIAKENKLPLSSGAYVGSSNGTAVSKGSPAEKAGLKEGDIITAVNGAKIGANGSLSSLLGEYAPGETVQLTVYRDNKELSINVTLSAYANE